MGNRHYFVDEAGDANIFNRKKQIVVGTEGCSSFFMLGMLDVRDVKALSMDMDDLSKDLQSDPYLKRVPTMRPEAGKTAIQFHAKDDVPEVRREVFRVLMDHDVRFYGTIRDKRVVTAYVRKRNERDANYRYVPGELYETLTRRLFSGRLHQNGQYAICFSRRGASDRTQALQDALLSARQDFQELSGIGGEGKIQVTATWAAQSRALQATDYFLWALQRLYEKRESRYWEYVWPKVRCVIDMDDTSRNPKGELYMQNNPLTGTLKTAKT
jgi:hypothetical protein